jgi:hypothetical protein
MAWYDADIALVCRATCGDQGGSFLSRTGAVKVAMGQTTWAREILVSVFLQRVTDSSAGLRQAMTLTEPGQTTSISRRLLFL